MPEYREPGVTVQVLDMTGLYDETVKMCAQSENPKLRALTKVDTPYRWGIATDRAGQTHLLCDEGVDFGVVTDDESLPFEVWDRSEPGLLSMVPAVVVGVTLSDLTALPSTDQDLSEFIRVFGARLEQNFRAVRKILVGE